jgi:hypothetical protein
MRSIAARLGLASSLVLGMAACGEVTEPLDVVEVRVAHAAPGLGQYTVLLNGQAFTSLPPMTHVYFPIHDVPGTYAFVTGADTLSRQITYEESVNAVVLMNASSPEIRYYAIERAFGAERLAIINGDFSTGDPLTIRVASGAFEFEEALAPGDHRVVDSGAGGFNVSVRPSGAEEFIEVQPFSLVPGDHGFLVLLRAPEPEEGFGRLLF